MQQVDQIEGVEADVIRQELDAMIAQITQFQETMLITQASNQQSSSTEPHRPIEEEPFFGMWADREDMKGKTSREWLQEQRRQHWHSRERIEDAPYFGMWADREDMKGKTSQEWVEELRREQWRRDERTDD